MITETEVKWWAIDRGVSCVIVSNRGTYVETLCGKWGNISRRSTSSNGRICRTCRQLMRVARPVEETT